MCETIHSDIALLWFAHQLPIAALHYVLSSKENCIIIGINYDLCEIIYSEIALLWFALQLPIAALHYVLSSRDNLYHYRNQL